MTLELIGISKRFSGFALGPLDIRVETNNILVVVGPTGSGKTTILNLITGLVKPDSGSILLNGIDITHNPVHLRRTGYIFQKPSLLPHLDVYENIVFGLPKKDRNKKRAQVRGLLDDLGISHLIRRNISDLSGGELQKISLARTLVTNPQVILMDEPLAHIDQLMQKSLRLELRKILKIRKIPSIYVTHFEDDVYALADSVLLLKNGLIEYTNSIDSFLTDQTGSRVRFLSSIFGKTNYLEGEVVESRAGVTTFKIESDLIEILGEYTLGSRVGILLKPEDLILSREFIRTSARNLLKTEITGFEANNPGVIDVHLKVGRLHIVSRITEQAQQDLRLRVGDYVYTVFKASSPQIIREQ